MNRIKKHFVAQLREKGAGKGVWESKARRCMKNGWTGYMGKGERGVKEGQGREGEEINKGKKK